MNDRLVENRFWSDWSPEMQKVLRRLTLPGESQLTDLVAAGSGESMIRTWVVFESKDPIAWAVLTRYDEIMMYVKKSHRRKGLGRKLLRRVKKSFPRKRITVIAWNRISGKFYASFLPKGWVVNDYFGDFSKMMERRERMAA